MHHNEFYRLYNRAHNLRAKEKKTSSVQFLSNAKKKIRTEAYNLFRETNTLSTQMQHQFDLENSTMPFSTNSVDASPNTSNQPSEQNARFETPAKTSQSSSSSSSSSSSFTIKRLKDVLDWLYERDLISESLRYKNQQWSWHSMGYGERTFVTPFNDVDKTELLVALEQKKNDTQKILAFADSNDSNILIRKISLSSRFLELLRIKYDRPSSDVLNGKEIKESFDNEDGNEFRNGSISLEAASCFVDMAKCWKWKKIIMKELFLVLRL